MLYVAPEVLEEKYDNACDVPSNSQELEELLMGVCIGWYKITCFFMTSYL